MKRTQPVTLEQLANEVARLRGLVTVLALAVTVAVGFAVWGFRDASSATSQVKQYARSHTESNARRSTVALTAAEQAHAIAIAIRAENQRTIVRECLGQNSNHRAAVRQLIRDYRPVINRARTPVQRRQLAVAERAAITEISKLAPFKHCR